MKLEICFWLKKKDQPILARNVHMHLPYNYVDHITKHQNPKDVQEAVIGAEPRIFLGMALTTQEPVARFLYSMRLFEAAFRHADKKLRFPLFEFLRGNCAGYTQKEIGRWIDLRGGSVHADRPSRVYFDSDVTPFLSRVRQAAIDVAFNKKNWGSPDTRRLDRAPVVHRIGPKLEVDLATVPYKQYVERSNFDYWQLALLDRHWSDGPGKKAGPLMNDFLNRGPFSNLNVVRKVGITIDSKWTVSASHRE